ncbi:hypothetical protein I6F34_01230 [Bradyrhizobium sp. BRP05]|nr:hypothetical protein [Bradyrhizobium sp. BRP05]
MKKFKKGDWVHSARKGSKPAFVGEVREVLGGGEYVIRDTERRRWLRHESELTPAARKEAA